MKFKIVGWLDLVLGGLGVIQQALGLLVVYPKMSALYEDFGVELPLSTRMYPYLTGVVILVFAGVVWVGWKLIGGKNPGDRLFKGGIIALGTMVLGLGYYMVSSALSLVYPLYSITSNL